MSDKNQNDRLEDPRVLQATTFGLIGRQSVRATFRLSEACIDAIQIVAAQLGIKQKSLFDHLVEDTALLEAIAREAREFERDKPQRVQKTFVISRRSLISLDSIARAFETPRDDLVEILVQRLLPVIKREQAQHRQRKQLLALIEANHKEANQLFNQVIRRLGEHDPMSNEFATVVGVYRSVLENMATIIEKGKHIEDFDIEAFKAKAIA